MLGKSIRLPQLRFPEFHSNWSYKKLGELGEFKNGFNADASAFGSGVEFINLMNIFGKSEISEAQLEKVMLNQTQIEQYSVVKGDVLFIRSSVKREGVAQSCLVNNNFRDTVYSGFIIRFREFKPIFDHFYKKYCFKSIPFRKKALSLSTTSANTNINQASLASINLFFPEIKEQKKIASFLSTVDEKIYLLLRKHECLQTYKRGVMQKIFSQEIRFKKSDGTAFPDWKEKILSDLVDRCTQKNIENQISRVLTNSATQGVLDQQDYFDKNIANSDNLSSYYIVEKGDYIYNPRISMHAPVGPINKNKIGEGVMSPLYSIFRFKSSTNTFYEQYFKTTFWHHYMCRVANYGARHDRMNITTADFMAMPLPSPHDDEQTKIVDFFEALDRKTQTTKDKLTAMETFKKGLLQKMFV
ncbi:MAG: restriction endonuclease subunit S [Arenicella sp.]